MQLKIVKTALLVLTVTLSTAQSNAQKQKMWTVAEVKTWTKENKDHSPWHGWVLYQGSDTSNHYFIARIMDDWMRFKIKYSDLSLKDERRYKNTSSAPLGYYYVDPLKDFIKVKDY